VSGRGRRNSHARRQEDPSEGAGLAAARLDLDERDGAVYLDVRVAPGSRREGILGTSEGALRVAVRAAPERGKANRALVGVLARAAGVRSSAVEIVSGRASRRKRVRIPGLAASELRERIGARGG
jgi:hypothetical protein